MPFLTPIEVLVLNSKKIQICISGLSGLHKVENIEFPHGTGQQDRNNSTNDNQDWLTEDGTKFLS